MEPHARRRRLRVPADHQAGMLLGRDFITAVVVFHETVGRRLGVSALDRKCLDLVGRLGPVTAGDLARHTGLTTGAITGMIDRLVKAEYVERVGDPTDRRKVLVRRKANGKLDTILPAVFGPLGEDMEAVTSRYTQDELDVIGDFLARTHEVLVNNTARVDSA
jgi:DNA-binding MarR family transcriptional regulator